MTTFDLIQLMLAACSMTALYLVTRDHPRARWIGAIVGLVGQPFWLIAGIMAGQWGSMICTIVFAIIYWRSIIEQRRKMRT